MPETTKYEITRLETKNGRVFFNIEIIDESGWYNFAKWLTPAQQQTYEENNKTINTIIDMYLPAAKAQRLRDLEAASSEEPPV